jgi:hypothetical protein
MTRETGVTAGEKGVDGRPAVLFPQGTMGTTGSWLQPLTQKLAHLRRRIPFEEVQSAFDVARRDLRAVGLLDEGRYLDHIDCEQTELPAWGETLGFVYDDGVKWFEQLVGFRVGVIYIPPNAPKQAYVPGGTLRDTVRHEFGHAWAWYDREFFEKPWFARAFGAEYADGWEQPAFDRADFVSEYACTAPKEDFAETFMVFLRARRSLHRYEGRAGVYAKLRAVEKAVERAVATRLDRPPPRRR